VPSPEGPLDLPALWNLALANNPSLREALASVEVTRGRLIQAGKYPNPTFRFDDDELGETKGPPGTIRLELRQEIVTSGKRQLDVAVAARGTDASSLALAGRKFEVLTRVRRAYYDYLGWLNTVRTEREVVATLGQAVETTRKLVEEAKTRPQSDLVRIEALLAEARINLARSEQESENAWRQVAAEVGVPGLPPPPPDGDLPPGVPEWDPQAVLGRVLGTNTDLRQAAVAAERTRLEVERARAEAVPNFNLGAGWTRNFPELEAGAVITFETALPLWDRKQGLILQAEARWAEALAAERVTANRLTRETAAALTRYRTARLQVERLTAEVLPRLRQNLELLRKGYQAGADQVTFSDILLAEESLNRTRLTLAEARRALWLAVAEVQGLMQLDLGEELGAPPPPCDKRPVPGAGCAPETGR
jgi:cobalt-zinc-cadmium efflux system outer membrane protein